MNKKVIIIIAVAVVLVAAIAFGVIFGMRFAGNGEGNGEIDVLTDDIVQIDIGEVYSNLAESRRVVKLNLTLAVKDGDSEDVINSRMSIVRDEINKIVRGKTEDDVMGAEGQINLKSEFIETLNEIFKTEDIVDIYFNEFIVQ